MGIRHGVDQVDQVRQDEHIGGIITLDTDVELDFRAVHILDLPHDFAEVLDEDTVLLFADGDESDHHFRVLLKKFELVGAFHLVVELPVYPFEVFLRVLSCLREFLLHVRDERVPEVYVLHKVVEEPVEVLGLLGVVRFVEEFLDELVHLFLLLF